MTQTVGVLDRSSSITDPCRVAGAEVRRPDPEVPERARRRTFTAAYKVRVLADYDAAPDGEKGAVHAGKACTPPTMWTGVEPATAAPSPG
jgi:transposase